MDVTKNDIEELNRSLSAKIEAIPKIIFDTEIEVENGKKQHIRFRDAVTQNWNRTASLESALKEGSLLVPFTDSDNTTSYKSLKELLSGLKNKDARLWDKTAKISDNISKIITFLIKVGVILYVTVLLVKTVLPNVLP